MKYILNNDNLEVVGKQYLQGVGGYDGTNPDTSSDIATYLPNMVNKTYKELYDLREDDKLVPGQQYRITDYETIISCDYASVEKHQFDIIVTANSTNSFSEVARAIQHGGENDYFADSNLDAWKIWYCFDNDRDRFEWADDTLDDSGNVKGKGVIYRMIDEWNNDLPYDFKNIKFKRYKLEAPSEYIATNNKDKWIEQLTNNVRAMFTATPLVNSYIWAGLGDGGKYWFGTYVQSQPAGAAEFFYTFQSVQGDGIDPDASLFGYCVGNKMMSSSTLPNNVFFGTGCNYNTFGRNCRDNAFDAGCSNNTFADNCSNNTFGNNCCYISFGIKCNSNNFSNYCYYNSFSNNCCYNSFDNNCYYNSFDNNCYYNSFGNNCYSNSFGNYCNSNSFSNGCENNSFGNSCNSNSFGNECDSNSFGNYCFSNSFGNNCSSNSFGNSCYSNSFRYATSETDVSDDSALRSACFYNHFDDGCHYNILWNENNWGNLQNVTVHRGTCGRNSAGSIIYNKIRIEQNKLYEIHVSQTQDLGIIKYCFNDTGFTVIN